MSFISAMDTIANQGVGVNGSDIYTRYQDDILDLFSCLNRDMDVAKFMESVLRITRSDDKRVIQDLFVLAFHTRDIMEGKGERDLFYRFLQVIYKEGKYREQLLQSLSLIPKYGSFLDIQHFLDKYYSDKRDDPIVTTLVQLYADTLCRDETSMIGTGKGLTLAGKWAPREGKQYDWIGKRISKVLYPTSNQGERWRNYRQLVSRLNSHLDTTERHMCHDKSGEHHFSRIDPAHVPARCLKSKRLAFLNESKGGEIRFPEDVDRMTCRTQFQNHMERALAGDKTARVHGRTLMPHEFVVEIERNAHGSEDERNVVQAQWNDLVNSIRESGSLGRVVVMCDFSGSMMGGHPVSPIQVSKGLGLLCAECATPAFRNRILTFDSHPTWHILQDDWNVFRRIQSFQGVSQGMSTNFQRATDLILTRLIEACVPKEEAPDTLLVITDMGFDQASGNRSNSFETHIQRVHREFQQMGYKAPTIVVWNVSGQFHQYSSQDTTEGTCTISGWSANILKLILEGGDIMAGLQMMTPMNIMRKVLDSERYAPVRAIFE